MSPKAISTRKSDRPHAAERALAISRRLCADTAALSFAAPVSHCYNPLEYAWEGHEEYLRRFAAGKKEVLLVGMNPGPFGMAQTGVPFGDVALVRDWMGIERTIAQPKNLHPKRPIEGFACSRSEVSGTRLWSWARDRFGSAEKFFSRFFVWNYCPLCFMEQSGRNRTPDKLPATERDKLFAACDRALASITEALCPEHVIGIGKFAELRIRSALRASPHQPKIGTILHPSPASPAANRGWAEQAERQLAALGIRLG